MTMDFHQFQHSKENNRSKQAWKSTWHVFEHVCYIQSKKLLLFFEIEETSHLRYVFPLSPRLCCISFSADSKWLLDCSKEDVGIKQGNMFPVFVGGVEDMNVIQEAMRKTRGQPKVFQKIFLGGRLGNLFVFEPFKVPSVWEGGRLGLICHLFSWGLENPSICSFYLQLVGKFLKVFWSHTFNTQGNALQDARNSLRSIVKLVIGIVITLVTFTKSDIMIPHIVARSVMPY